MEAAAPSVPAFREPPVTQLGMVSIVLVAGGVIYLAAYLPKRAPLGPAIALLIAAAVVIVLNALLLSRRPSFAWWRFRQVAAWMLLAFAIISGMIEYAFVYDHTRGAVLAIMTALLAIYTLNVPLIAGYTVARFEGNLTRPS